MATTLYRMFDEGGALLYVGITKDTRKRFSQHADKHWFSQVVRVEVETFDSRGAAASAERAAIRDEAPVFNRAGRPTAPRRMPGVVGRSGGAKDLISLQDAASMLGVSTKTLRRRVADGTLVAYRVGPKLLRVDRFEVESRFPRQIPAVVR